MKFLPLTLILTLFASLFVAYVINPVFAVTFMKRHEDDNHEEKQSFQEIKRPLIILTVLAGIGYVIDRGIGNLMVLVIILYVFNHYVLTPKMIVPFQERLLPALKNGYRSLISWVLTGWRPVFAIVGAFALLILTFIITGIAKPKVIFFPQW